jgi:prepilin peptidase CpaA
MGGGDVKILTVAFLSLGLERSSAFALFLSAFAFLYALGARADLLPSRPAGTGKKVPYGPSIAAAWLATLALAGWSG